MSPGKTIRAGLEAEKRKTNLMHCVAQQHYRVVVNRKPSFLFYTGGPPHQQSVLQSDEQPAATKQLGLVNGVCVCVCVYGFVWLCVCYNLKGKALQKTSRGLGPAVYLLMITGSRICRGTMGTASNASCSLGTPASTSFRPVTASAAEKPI